MIHAPRTIAFVILALLALASPLLTASSIAHAQTAEATDTTLLLRSGTFVNAIETGNGTVTLSRLPDATYLLRLENFRVDFGPDLRVQLTASADGAELDIAGLKANRGNQTYTLPATFDPDRYDAARIYCRFFHIVMIVAPLAPQ